MATTEHEIVMNEIIKNEDGSKDTKILYPTTKAEVCLCEDGETVEEKLNSKSNSKKTYTATIDTTWTGILAPYTKEITVTGVLATDIVNLYPIWSTDLETRKTEKEEYAKISMVEATAENTIQLTCDEEIPNIKLNVRIEVVY